MSDNFPIPYIGYSLKHLGQIEAMLINFNTRRNFFYFCFHRCMKKYSHVRLERDSWSVVPRSYVNSSSPVLKLVRILSHYHVGDLLQIALVVT